MSNQPAVQPLNVKIAVAAKMMSMCERSIYNLIYRGELKTVGKGRLKRIPIAEIHAYNERELHRSEM